VSGGTLAIDGPLKHGARSKVMLLALTDARVDELRALIREHGARWLTEADEGLLTTAARNLVIVDQMWSYIVQRGAIDSQGRTRAVMEYWARINGVLTRQLTALGLGPVARSELVTSPLSMTAGPRDRTHRSSLPRASRREMAQKRPRTKAQDARNGARSTSNTRPRPGLALTVSYR
jgi:hypothetical protein